MVEVRREFGRGSPEVFAENVLAAVGVHADKRFVAAAEDALGRGEEKAVVCRVRALRLVAEVAFSDQLRSWREQLWELQPALPRSAKNEFAEPVVPPGAPPRVLQDTFDPSGDMKGS